MKANLEMSYTKYETDIVHKYGVELASWPLPTFEIDSVSRERLQDVVDGLLDGTIKWTRLSDAELNARIDAWNAKRRKQDKQSKKNKQSKKDKTKKRKRARVASEEVHSDSDDEAASASEQSARTTSVLDQSTDQSA